MTVAPRAGSPGPKHRLETVALASACGYVVRQMSKPVPTPATGIELKDFEHSLDELERLVARLEEGNLSLEETLGEFERGMRLHGQCQQALDLAQQRVELMLKNSDYRRSVPFDSEPP
jgi:exodeoxyribonuclease VII small subunit